MNLGYSLHKALENSIIVVRKANLNKVCFATKKKANKTTQLLNISTLICILAF